MTTRPALIIGLASVLISAAAHGQERNFRLPAAETANTLGDGGMEFTDADFEGGVLQRLTGQWPEDLVIAPVPGRSPQVGWSLALGGGYFLQSKGADDARAPSILGGFGWYAGNGSYAFGAGGNLHLLDDDLRVKFGAGYLDVRYTFYGIGSESNDNGLALDILQEAPMYFASASYRVWKKLYVGLGYFAGDVDTRPRFAIGDSPLDDIVLSLNIGALTLPLIVDTRDHQQFPRQGWLISGHAMLYRDTLGSDFNAESFTFEANRYLPVRGDDVLAFRGYFRTTSGDAPFFVLSSFGGKSDLRGYPSGRYRDKMMYALQGEYRWTVNDKWILTGFAGFGEVASNVRGFGDNFLPATGVGGRFVLSQKHRVSLSFDVAYGKDGTEYYFGVGEAF